jgi:hypothetical protein
MGNQDLVNELIGLCFFPVFGTVEFSPGSMRLLREGNEPQLVDKRDPFTWDSNNGTYVVYDDEGKPWIRSTTYVDRDWMKGNFASRHNLKQGAFVPHSNDGGRYKQLVATQTGEHI